MRKSVQVLGGVSLLVAGYVLGATQMLSPASLFAQGDAKKAASGVAISDEAKTKIKAASDALKSAMDALIDDNKYNSATKGVNCFAVMTGGGNAMRDLEANAVVDPETYAALYADLAVDSVAANLHHDAEGRLTYKGKVIRILPLSVLRSRYAVRADLTGEELLPTAPEDDAAKAKKAAGEK